MSIVTIYNITFIIIIIQQLLFVTLLPIVPPLSTLVVAEQRQHYNDMIDSIMTLADDDDDDDDVIDVQSVVDIDDDLNVNDNDDTILDHELNNKNIFMDHYPTNNNDDYKNIEQDHSIQSETSFQSFHRIRALQQQQQSQCTNVCNGSSGERENDDVNEGDGLLNVITNYFGHLFSAIFSHRTDKESEYAKLQSIIVPVLSNYSLKSMALTNILQQEQPILVNDTTLSTNQANILNMMFNVSAMNMELLSSVIDTMVVDMKQSTADQMMMDIQTMGCYMTQIVSVVQNTTLPAIELMVKVLYTKMGNDETKDRYEQYTATRASKNSIQPITPPSSTAATTAAAALTTRCLDTTTGTTKALITSSSRTIFVISGLLFGINETDGPLIHLTRIILLLILSPISIVVGVLAVIPTVLSFLLYVLTGGFGGFLLLFFLLFPLVTSPLSVLLSVWDNLNDLILDLLYGIDRETIMPTSPPFNLILSTPVQTPVTIKPPTQAVQQQSGSVTSTSISNTDDILDHALSVLNSPINTIIHAVENVDSSTLKSGSSSNNEDAYNYNKDEINCEVAVLTCQSNALLNIIPF